MPATGKTALRTFAAWARARLYDAVTRRAALLRDGQDVTADPTLRVAADAWFLRMILLRCMEANGFPAQPLFTPPSGGTAADGGFREALLRRSAEAEALLPDAFPRLPEEVNLLCPEGLDAPDGFVTRLLAAAPEETWRDAPETVGWLYQYYQAPVKDEAFALLKRGGKIPDARIPAATQLFTPAWTARYMAQNSIGRLWAEANAPYDVSGWEYYAGEAKQTEAVRAALRRAPEGLAPEDLRVLDPCAGGGNLLTAAFDVLTDVYSACGVPAAQAAIRILKYNLYGLDIDPQMEHLCVFALLMKACRYNKNIFYSGVRPHVYALTDASFLTDEVIRDAANGDKEITDALAALRDAFAYAGARGSLLRPPPLNTEALQRAAVSMTCGGRILRLLEQAELLNGTYDVVIANPPYLGSPGLTAEMNIFLKENYPDAKGDLFACFLRRGTEWLKPHGCSCMVTAQSWMFLSGFETLRRSLLENHDLTCLLHMQTTVMEIAFGTAVSVLRAGRTPGYRGTCHYIGVKDMLDGAPVCFPPPGGTMTACAEDFTRIPGCPVAYWAHPNIGKAFAEGTPAGRLGNARSGMQTGNNSRFLRAWYEVDFDDIRFDLTDLKDAGTMPQKWVPQPKGGPYRRWYGNLEFVVNYAGGGRALREYDGTSLLKNPQFYLREGVTWSHTTSGAFSARYLPPGTIFNVESPAFYPDKPLSVPLMLGFFNSKVCGALFACLNRTMHFMPGDAAKLPLRIPGNDVIKRVEALALENVEIAKTDWDENETSWDFTVDPLLRLRRQQNEPDLRACLRLRAQETTERFCRMKANEEELNRIFTGLYALEGALSPDVSDGSITVRPSDDAGEIAALVSYAVGCLMGRYSLRAPGLACAGKGGRVPEGAVPDGILTAEMFVPRFARWLAEAFGEDMLEENLRCVSQTLGLPGEPRNALEKYFRRGFYADHVRRYRKRPVYFMASSGQPRTFAALIYLHRLPRDLPETLLNCYVLPLAGTIAEARRNNRTDRNLYEKQRRQLKELASYAEKLRLLCGQDTAPDPDAGAGANHAKLAAILEKI